MDDKFPTWQGRRVVSDAHKASLEHAAAIHEFEGGKPRKEAEAHAYDEYKREHHAQAAAHHLLGMRAAQATGDMDESGKHGMAYDLHLRSLGHDPLDEVPPEIKKLVDDPERKGHYKFKTHRSDAMLLPSREEPAKEEEPEEELEKGDLIRGKFPTKQPTAPNPVTQLEPTLPQPTNIFPQAKEAILPAPPAKHPHTWQSILEDVGDVLGGECGARALDDDEDYDATRDALADRFAVHPDVIHHELRHHTSRAMDDDEDLGHVQIDMAEHLRKYFGQKRPKPTRPPKK